MSLANKILLGLIFVVTLVAVIMSARALKTHDYWQSLVQKQEQAIVDGTLEQEQLTDQKRVLARDLHQVLMDRGRVWRGVQPGERQAQNNDLLITAGVPQPVPHGIANKSVLFIFEEKSAKESGQFLGQFTVTGVGENQVQMRNSMKLSPSEVQRLQQSTGPWLLYEIMPRDETQIFSVLGADAVKGLLPENAAEFFLTKERKLRDYEVLFRHHHDQWSRSLDRMAAAQADIQAMTAAVASAKQQEQFRRQEIETLKQDLAVAQREREATIAHYEAVSKKLSEVETAVANLMKQNQSTAADLARMQLEISRVIDSRTREMAQADR